MVDFGYLAIVSMRAKRVIQLARIRQPEAERLKKKRPYLFRPDDFD